MSHGHDFEKERIKTVNLASYYLYLWIMAMYNYYKIYTNTAPLRAKLIEVEKIVT